MKKKLILLFLVSLPMMGCYTNPKNLKDLRSEFVSMDDSVIIHYKKWGDGNKAICFVHGFGCDLSTWERQFEGLRDEKGLQLVFVDLPGFGESSKPHSLNLSTPLPKLRRRHTIFPFEGSTEMTLVVETKQRGNL